MAGYTSVVMLHNPPLDKCAALYILSAVQGQSVTSINYWGHPECPSELFEEWERNDCFPIDIGDNKYSRMGADSATEAVLMKLEYLASITPGERKLIDILGRHNSGRNNLKGYKMSLAYLIRKAYALPGYDATDIILRAVDVVRAFVEYENLKAKSGRTAKEPLEALANLYQETAICRNEPFTIGRYLDDMVRLGEPEEDVRQKVIFWLEVQDRVQLSISRARTAWPSFARIEFSVGGMNGAAIETSDIFLTEVGAPTVDILIVRNPETGHTAILTKRKNLSQIYEALSQAEPNIWHHHKKAGQVLNGGPLYPKLQSTSLTLQEQVLFIRQFPPQ